MSDDADFFAMLNAEVSKHLAEDKLRKDRDQAKKRANTIQLSREARAKASDEYRELSRILEASEWASVSTVAMFSEQSCDGCGSSHLIFLQYMEQQQLIRKPSTQRWVRVTRPAPAEVLPRETLIQPMTTHLCAHCCEDHGFGLLSAQRLSPRSDTITPSTTYTQEDINGQAA